MNNDNTLVVIGILILLLFITNLVWAITVYQIVKVLS